MTELTDEAKKVLADNADELAAAIAARYATIVAEVHALIDAINGGPTR